MADVKKRAWIWLLVLLFLLAPCSVAADGEARLELDVPDEIRGYLPEGIWEEDVGSIYDSFSFSYFWKTGWRLFFDAVPDVARTFALLLGLLLLSACLRVLRDLVTSPALGTVLEFTGLLAVSTAIFAATDGLFSFADAYISSLSKFMPMFTPAMTALMIGSGNITSAAVLSGVLSAALSLLEQMCAGALLPLMKMCLAVAAVGTLFGDLSLSSILPTMKKVISYVMGFVTLCLSAVVAFQGILAKSADSLALKAVKFAVGAFVPLVGSAVNEAISTVAGGLGALKAATGIVGAVTVALIAAAPLCAILAHKLFLEVLGVCAGVLGLSSEGKLIGEISSFFGYVAAILAISAVFFILTLSLMASVSV